MAKAKADIPEVKVTINDQKAKKTPTQVLKDELGKLKRENKQLQKQIIEEVKKSSVMEGMELIEASMGINYAIDDTKSVNLGLKAKIATSNPTEAHEILYLKLLTSLESIIQLTLGGQKEQSEEKE